jgi:hypothetical protein
VTEPIPTHHAIEWTIESGGRIGGKATCTAPVGARCRHICPQHCEESCDHPKVDGGYCNVIDWLNADDLDQCYGGSATAVRRAPIVTRWEGDHHGWIYADDPTAAEWLGLHAEAAAT